MKFGARHPWRIPFIADHPYLAAIINVALAIASVAVTFVVTQLL